MSYETVELNVTKLSENKYRDGNKVYIVANLIERAKELEPFDLPLIALNASSNVSDAASFTLLREQLEEVLETLTIREKRVLSRSKLRMWTSLLLMRWKVRKTAIKSKN